MMFISIMFLLKKNVNYFSSIYVLRKKVCLHGGGLSIVAETTFPWYLKNDLAYWLQMSEHQFSKAVEAYKVLYLRNYAANVNLQ